MIGVLGGELARVVVSAEDPNWFFSTLSQSAAAMVGIVGGFFVSRLLQQSNTVKESKELLFQDWGTVREALAIRRDSLRQFKAWAEEKLPEIEAALERGEDHVMSSTKVDWSGGSSTASPRPLDVSHEYATMLCRQTDLVDRGYDALDDLVKIDDLARLDVTELGMWMRKMDPTDRESLEYLRSQLDVLVRAIAGYRATALPRYSNTLLVLLGWLAAIGVVLPLTQLSDGGRQLWKTLLTAGFAAGIVGLGFVLVLLGREIAASASLALPEKVRWTGT